MFERIREDVNSVMERDPAARSRLEVLLCYPGLWAVWFHRVSHRLWRMKLRLPARVLSQIARFYTGVDIHPGALLGRRLFIDHAMGVVIGETAIVGSDVTIYQGVTLGGTGKGHGKRHPTHVRSAYSSATTRMCWATSQWARTRGWARVSVVLSDVPPNSTVVGVPAHIVYRAGQRVLITDPHEIKDPLSDALIALADRVDALEGCLGQAAQGAPFADGRGRAQRVSQGAGRSAGLCFDGRGNLNGVASRYRHEAQTMATEASTSVATTFLIS